MLKNRLVPRKAYDEYLEFKDLRFPARQGRLLSFHGVEGHDVYNTSVPFELDGRRIIAGRVERRDSEDACTRIFEEREGDWQLIKEAASVPGLQDPFVTSIDGNWILGGVHALWREDGSLITYHTDFYRINSLSSLSHIAEGPALMKDIRLIQLPDGRIAVFSRPQGEAVKHLNRVASIGFGIINNLNELTADGIAQLPLLEGHFTEDEWGGCNQLQILKNGLIGCIGHKSWGHMQEDVFVIHYYCFANAIDPQTLNMTPVKIIASRDCFPDAPQKNPRAYDVCFTSGIIRQGNGRALLYTGMSDAFEGELEIEDPFAEYENGIMA